MGKITSKFRVFGWFLSGLLKRHLPWVLISFIVSVFIAVVAISFYPVIAPIINPYKEKVGVVGEFSPSDLPLSVQSLVSSGLTSVTLEGSPSASLASSWSTDNDGKIYTFKVNTDIIWHDGTNFSALDVNYNLKDAIVIPKDFETVEVRLNDPYVPLPVILSKPLFKKGLIGVGLYKVKSLKLNGDKIEYLELVPVSQKLPIKIFRFYQTEEAAITAFKLGEIDIIEDLSDPRELKDWSTVDIEEKVLLNRYVGLFFNTRNPNFFDKDTRQLLSIATPAFYGNKPTGPISPLSWTYYPTVKQYNQDLELAKKRLEDSRFATESASITISTFQNLLPVAQKIQEDWKSIGLNSTVKVENAVPADFDVLLATQEIPPDPDQYPFWHSTQDTINITGFADPRIDKLLEDGRVTKDNDERLKIYADFQRFLAEESPVAYLYYPRVYTVRRK
ncbi:hypothetical protein HYT02_00685 [Candidatus Gottesmanbacteria bacterium]|nr:hypothetical protein [Candidatus Gottesmanbacteria bacterium]